MARAFNGVGWALDAGGQFDSLGLTVGNIVLTCSIWISFRAKFTESLV